MTERSNPYVILGVPSDATPAEITHAFRAKLRSLHPDTRPVGVGDRGLRDLLSAYEQLRDIRRRPDRDRTVDTDAVHSSAPVDIPVTHRQRGPQPNDTPPLWAGPVRRHSR